MVPRYVRNSESAVKEKKNACGVACIDRVVVANIADEEQSSAHKLDPPYQVLPSRRNARHADEAVDTYASFQHDKQSYMDAGTRQYVQSHSAQSHKLTDTAVR